MPEPPPPPPASTSSMSMGSLMWSSLVLCCCTAPPPPARRPLRNRPTSGSLLRDAAFLARPPRHSAWILHAASLRIALFHSRYCMYVLASGARSAWPLGGRPCIRANASSNWVICARSARQAATVRFRSAGVDVSAR